MTAPTLATYARLAVKVVAILGGVFLAINTVLIGFPPVVHQHYIIAGITAAAALLWVGTHQPRLY